MKWNISRTVWHTHKHTHTELNRSPDYSGFSSVLTLSPDWLSCWQHFLVTLMWPGADPVCRSLTEERLWWRGRERDDILLLLLVFDCWTSRGQQQLTWLQFDSTSTHSQEAAHWVCVCAAGKQTAFQESLKMSVVEFLWEAEGSAGGSRGRKGGAKGFPWSLRKLVGNSKIPGVLEKVLWLFGRDSRSLWGSVCPWKDSRASFPTWLSASECSS